MNALLFWSGLAVMGLGAFSHPLGLRHDKKWLVYLSYVLLFVGGIMLWICQSNIGSSGDPDIPLFGGGMSDATMLSEQ